MWEKSFLVRPSIGKALANDTGDRFFHTLRVADAKRHALVVTIIELGKITLQMLFADVMIDAGNAALHD